MKGWLWIGFALAIIAGCGGSKLAALRGKVHEGMTIAEVEAVLGKPDQQATSDMAAKIYTYVNPDQPLELLAVGFDRDGKVVRVDYKEK